MSIFCYNEGRRIFEQQEREVREARQARREEIQRRPESETQARLVRGLSGVHLSGSLGAALLIGAVGGVIFPVLLIGLALGGWLRWAYGQARRVLSRRPD
jgi:hypothetical protein